VFLFFSLFYPDEVLSGNFILNLKCFYHLVYLSWRSVIRQLYSQSQVFLSFSLFILTEFYQTTLFCYLWLRDIKFGLCPQELCLFFEINEFEFEVNQPPKLAYSIFINILIRGCTVSVYFYKVIIDFCVCFRLDVENCLTELSSFQTVNKNPVASSGIFIVKI
jgi:hypothetical protein